MNLQQHLDKAAPHAHALLLHVVKGRHVGSALFDTVDKRDLRESFFNKVAGPAGLRRGEAKVRSVVKQWAVSAVLARCEKSCWGYLL